MNDLLAYSTEKQNLKENLKLQRKAHKFTQQQIANFLSINRTAYTAYESGKNSPSIYQIRDLATLYGISIDDFFNNL